MSRVGGRGGDSFLSPDLQREEIARAATREGLRVVDVLEELDASGGDTARPLWNEAIRRVEDGEVGAVIVWNLSRFSRSVKDALTALDRIRAAGGRLVSAVRPGERDWVKVKNPSYWRRDAEREAMQRSRERRRATLPA